MRINPCEFGAEEKDLRRVVDPKHEHHERAGRTEGGADRALAEIQSDEELADGEERRGHRGTDPDVVPADVHPRDVLVDEREEHRREAKAEDDFEQVGDDLRRAPPLAERGDRCAENERHGEQERDAEHHAEGQQTRAQEVPPAFAFLARRRSPDAVERVLQLAENGRRTEKQSQHADDGGDHALRGAIGGLQHPFDRLGAVGADQPGELAEDLAARRLGTENQARHRDDDEQQRRNREQRVIGKGRPDAGRVVLAPRARRLLEQVERRLCREPHAAPRCKLRARMASQ